MVPVTVISAQLAAASPSSRRALIVGATLARQPLCRGTLEELGFSVDAVDDGVAAVTAAREVSPDVIFMEAQLRDVSGSEAVGWLRGNPRLQGTPIILVASERRAFSEAKGEFSTMLRKPLSTIAIRHAIAELFG